MERWWWRCASREPILPTCGAILVAALSCSMGPVLSIKSCATLHYLSCEEAVASFKTNDQALPPGSLRQVFVNKLFKMDEVFLQSKAPTVWAWTLPSPQSQPYALAGVLKYASLCACTLVCDVCECVSKQFVVLL